MVSCQKGPTHHAYTWQIGPFWHDTLDYSDKMAPWLPYLYNKSSFIWKDGSFPSHQA